LIALLTVSYLREGGVACNCNFFPKLEHNKQILSASRKKVQMMADAISQTLLQQKARKINARRQNV
jgi:hypothetical protein